jgi:hypothetical protein
MSLTLISQPERWTSAYRPIEFAFRSTLQDGTEANDNIPILDITQLGVETVLRLTNQFASGDINVGEPIRIAGTTFGTYDGTWRVTRIVATTFDVQVAINAPYTSDDFGGTATRIYDNLRVGCEVVFTRFGTIAVPFTLDADPDGIFTLNIEDAAQRQFASPFTEALYGGPANIYLSANTSVAMGYYVVAFERYTAWTNGVPSVVEIRKPFELNLRGYRVVNMVHPYHQEFNDGGIALDWQDTLDDYIFSQQATGRKFLTWGDRNTQQVGPNDPFYLAMLWDAGSQTNGTDLVVSTYQSDGTFINSTSFDLDATPDYAAFLNVGPDALGSAIPANAAYYLVGVRNRNDGFISETFRLNIDRNCHEVGRRMYWQNKLGGIDQYTFKGREVERTVTQRDSIVRRYIPLNSTRGFNARMYRTTPERRFVLSSLQVNGDVLRWLVQDFFESSDVAALINTKARTPHYWWTPVLILSDEAMGRTSENLLQRLVIEYTLGVDNRSQYA